jgi:lysyl-tRNA synthetase, class II
MPNDADAHRRARRLGFAVVAIGVLNLVSAFSPWVDRHVELVDRALTPGVPDLASGAAATLGVVLVLVGRGLVQRRRVACWTAIVAVGASTVAQVLEGSDRRVVMVSLLVLTMLVLNRRVFVVVADRRRTRTLAFAVPAVLGAIFAYGLAGLSLERQGIHPALTLGSGMAEIAARLVGRSGPLHLPTDYVWLPVSITILGSLAGFVLIVYTLAPIRERVRMHDADRLHVRDLVDRADGDTLDPFALRTDKRYVFSADRRAAIAYRYVNGVGLASGDPVGDPDAFAGALEAWLLLCRRGGWRPAILGTRVELLPLYEAHGLRAHYLGDEAVIDVGSFALAGRRMRPVRQACQRIANAGYSTEIHREGELGEPLHSELRDLAHRARHGAPERGFSMALDGLLSGRDGDCVVAVTRDDAGIPVAFQRYVPCMGGRGLSLDAMRRDRTGPNGVNERMIADVVAWAKQHGVEQVSLNFAFFRAFLDEGARLKGLQTLEAWFVKRANPYFQIESLLRFNAKFDPTWRPRYLVYRSVGELASVGVAALSAESFLPFDRRPQAYPVARPGAEAPASGVAVTARSSPSTSSPDPSSSSSGASGPKEVARERSSSVARSSSPR